MLTLQFMVNASLRSQERGLVDQIKTIIFLGTPHQGSNLAQRSKLWWFGGTDDIRAVLQPGSQVLNTLHQKFMNLSIVQNNTRIYSFYEQRPSHYGPSLLKISMLVSALKDFKSRIDPSTGR